jgi:hypothetical protein
VFGFPVFDAGSFAERQAQSLSAQVHRKGSRGFSSGAMIFGSLRLSPT